jgi:hypothetical protein
MASLAVQELTTISNQLHSVHRLRHTAQACDARARQVQVARAACQDGGAWLKFRSGHLVDGGKRQGGPLASDEFALYVSLMWIAGCSIAIFSCLAIGLGAV